jgi:cyclophilin family peptidyl-prolyl cis-trans isomerase
VLTNRNVYDGTIFHRVIEGFMAQGGDPKGTGEGGSDLPDLKAEFNDLPHVRGTLAMARAESPDSANSQFYIMLSPNLQLDRKYTVVGRVYRGMGYVDGIAKGEPPEHPTKIVHAWIGAPPADPNTPPVADTPAVAAPATLAVPSTLASPTPAAPAPKAPAKKIPPKK